MTHTADPRIDAYFDALPDWQQAICREVRDLALTAMFNHIIANNRAGGWRKLKRES